MFRTTIALSISLAAMLAIPSTVQAQGLFGNTLNDLARKNRMGRQQNPYSDFGGEKYLVEFSLRNETLTFEGISPVENLTNESRSNCIADLNRPGELGPPKYLSQNPLQPRRILKGSIYQANEYIAKDGDGWKLYAAACGPISLPPGSIVDTSNLIQFSSVGVDTNSLVVDANADIVASQRAALAEATQKTKSDANQAKLDKLWLHASVTYLANGQMSAAGQGEFSPFASAIECNTAVGQMRRAAILKAGGNAYPLGEAVIAMTDGSGWLWVGCVSVKDVNSGTFTSYMDVKMTAEKAKTLKAVLDFPSTNASPPPKRGSQTKF
jgi:hypothetical protein